MNLLEILFNLIKNKFYKLRKKNPNIDGKLLWQPIKKELSLVDIKATKWKNISKKVTIDIMNIPEYYLLIL